MIISMILLACGDVKEAPTASIEVYSEYMSSRQLTNLGWQIDVDSLQIGIYDLSFHGHTAHAKLALPFISAAFAHPGHGEEEIVIGELLGDFIWKKDEMLSLGEATLTIGSYSYVNMGVSNQLAEDIAISITGTAENDGDTIPFFIEIEAPADRFIEQIPFEVTISDTSTEVIFAQFHLVDPFETTHLFDDIDFMKPENAGDVFEITPTNVTDDYTKLRQRMLAHDHYVFTMEEK